MKGFAHQQSASDGAGHTPYAPGHQAVPNENEGRAGAITRLHPSPHKSPAHGRESAIDAPARAAQVVDISRRTPIADRYEKESSHDAARISVARSKRIVLLALGRGFLLSLIVSVPVLLLWLDVQWLSNSVGELSFTELGQLVLLGMTVVTLASLAGVSHDDRRFATLAAGFFACMLIRECDAALDVLMDGLWQGLVIVVSAACVVYAASDWRATLRGMARLVVSRAGMLLIVALAILLAYSRLLGMGALWHGLLGEEYLRVLKNSIEEGTELLGYVLICVASLSYASHRLRRLKRSSRAI